ncbi:MAG: sensor histidine kinase [Fibrobacterota bacterium]
MNSPLRSLENPRLYNLIMKVQPFSGRTVLLITCIGAFLFYIVFFRAFIGSLRVQTEQSSSVYAELISSLLEEDMSHEEKGALFRKVFRQSSNPLVVTGLNGEPVYWANIKKRRFLTEEVLPDPDHAGKTHYRYVKKRADRYRGKFTPQIIRSKENGSAWGYLVFGSNPFIDSLFWMPFIEIGLLLGIIITTYSSFRNIRITERSNLWVGLAKETAHQLGTPISSLMGWVEYLKSVRDCDVKVDRDELLLQVEKICEDMDYDLKRLKKVTARFSQIGSVPSLVSHNINDSVSDVISYFKIRLPLHRRRITMEASFGELPRIAVNRELLEWVFENMIKNSIDAIQKSDGIIEIRTEYVGCDHLVRITHRDNGKGVLKEDYRKIFAPGYTTKKRGWGLGLTLAKRIIEDYHGGRIYISWSQKEKGTVFTIDLPVRSVGKAVKVEGAVQNGNA